MAKPQATANKVSKERELAIRVVLLPRDTNQRGTIFGGTILSQIDLAAAVEASKHTHRKLVTVAMKEVICQDFVQTPDI